MPGWLAALLGGWSECAAYACAGAQTVRPASALAPRPVPAAAGPRTLWQCYAVPHLQRPSTLIPPSAQVLSVLVSHPDLFREDDGVWQMACFSPQGAFGHATMSGMPMMAASSGGSPFGFEAAAASAERPASTAHLRVRVPSGGAHGPSPFADRTNSRGHGGSSHERKSAAPTPARAFGGPCLSLSPFFDEISASAENTPIRDQQPQYQLATPTCMLQQQPSPTPHPFAGYGHDQQQHAATSPSWGGVPQKRVRLA